MDSTAITAVFGGLVLLIGALTAAFVAWNGRAIHRELKTMNAGTVGTFASDDETRRIEAIPHDDRTPTEQTHLDEAPAKEAPQGPVIAAIYDAVNGKPADQPTLYDLVQTLDMKVDNYQATTTERFDRLEQRIGIPDEDATT